MEVFHVVFPRHKQGSNVGMIEIFCGGDISIGEGNFPHAFLSSRLLFRGEAREKESSKAEKLCLPAPILLLAGQKVWQSCLLQVHAQVIFSFFYAHMRLSASLARLPHSPSLSRSQINDVVE